GSAALCFHRLRAQMQQNVWDVDLDGANLVARPAQARRVRQRRVSFDALELRREDRADRAGVDGAVRVTTRARVDGADVEARAAADAVQRLSADLVGQHARPAVVEQDNMQLLW